MAFYTYILACSDGSYYTGHTDNLDNRIAAHHSGLLRGYTYSRRPVRLVWTQEFPTRHEALAAERQIKGWSRAKKEALIDRRWDELSRLAIGRSNFVLRQAQDERVLVTEGTLNRLRAEAGHAHPLECCGFLLGHTNRITAISPARNVHPAAQTHFEIDPQALVDAHRAARAGGPQVLGYYHSHPNGPAEPSATDRAEAAHDGAIWAVVTGKGDVTFWRDDESGFVALPYVVPKA